MYFTYQQINECSTEAQIEFRLIGVGAEHALEYHMVGCKIKKKNTRYSDHPTSTPHISISALVLHKDLMKMENVVYFYTHVPTLTSHCLFLSAF